MTKFSIEPKSQLFNKICSRILAEERSFCMKRVMLFSLILFLSALGFAPALKMFMSDLGRSGFPQFFSLIFSDYSVVASYWKNFAILLAESLPALSLALLLIMLLGILQSTRYLTKDIRFLIKTKV